MRKCELCKSTQRDDVKYGEFLTEGDMSVHTYCLYLTSNLAQSGEDDEGFLGFLPADIKQECRRISRLSCCYCNKTYANIGCCVPKCRRTFHTICGLEHGAANHFTGTYQSFCDQHVGKVPYRPTREELCSICFDSLWLVEPSGGTKRTGRFSALNMLRAPCCRNGWFHKFCLQTFARTAGYFFKCPLCNDKEKFCNKLAHRGIFIPNRDAAWELEPNAFAELLERPNSCVASECLNKRGRTEQTDSNPLLLCATCGSVAIHKLCNSSRNISFNCDDCQRLLSAANENKSLEAPQQNEEEDGDNEVDVCDLSDAESDIVANISKHRRIDAAADDDEAVMCIDAEVKAEADKDDEQDRIIASKKLDHSLRILDDESDNEACNPPTPERFRHVTMRRKHNIRRISDGDDNNHDDDDDANVAEAMKCNEHKTETELVHLFNKEEPKEELIKSANLNRLTSTNFIITDNDDSFSNTDEDDEFEIYKSKTQSFVISQRTRITTDSVSENGNNCDVNVVENTATDCNNPTLVSVTITKHMPKEDTENNSCRNCSSGSSGDDDPLENPFAFLKQKQNSRYEEPISKPRTRNSVNKLNKSTQELVEVKAEPPQPLDISCIASRTRRKSLIMGKENKCDHEMAAAINLEHPWPEAPQKVTNNSLETSCIAMRTRRKSFYLASPSNSDAENNRRHSFKNVHDTTRDSVSSFHSAFSSSSSAETHYHQPKSLEISCIASRTRRRKSLKCQSTIPAMPSPSPSSSSLSNSSSFSSATSASFDSTKTTTDAFHSLGSSNSELSCSGTYRASSSSSSSSSPANLNNKRFRVPLKRFSSQDSNSSGSGSNSKNNKRLRHLSSTDADADIDEDDDYDCDATPTFARTVLASCSAASTASTSSIASTSNSTFGSKLQRRCSVDAEAAFNLSQQQSTVAAYIAPTFTRVDGKLKRVPTNIAEMRGKAETAASPATRTSPSMNSFWKSYDFMQSCGNSSSDEHSQRKRIQRSLDSSSSNENYNRESDKSR